MKKLLFIVLLLSTLTSFATHLAGGEMTYTCIGTRTWKVTLTLYRDCTGIPMCPSMACTKTLIAKPNTTYNMFGCTSLPSSIPITVSLVKVEDAELYRKNACGNLGKNGCDNLGQVTSGSYSPSVEKYIFEGVLNLSAPIFTNTSCPYWDITFEEAARNYGSTNISSSPNMYLVSTINIASGVNQCLNNSPIFTNEAIITVHSGRETSFSPGGVDPDGDSLTYKIVKALGTGGSPVTYMAPFSEVVPFPLNTNAPPHTLFPGPAGQQVILDEATGLVRFNAVNSNIYAIFGQLVINVYQWRYNNGNPELVGITQRDMQIYVRNSPANRSPYISTTPAAAGNAPIFNYSVCGGDSVSFIVTAKDTDFYPQIPRSDTTKLSWNNPISRPGRLFFGSVDSLNKREDQWKFFWQTQPSDGRNLPYDISVIAVDNFCPNIGYTNRIFSIKVSPVAGLTATKQKLSCDRYIYTVKKTTASQVLTSVILKVALKPNDYSFAGGYKLVSSTQPNPATTGTWPKAIITDTLLFTKPGNYYVQYIGSLNQGCTGTYIDTIVIGNNVLPNTPDTSICSGLNVSYTLPTGRNFVWKALNSTDTLSTTNQLTIKPTGTVSVAYYGEVNDSGNVYCQVSDTILITLKSNPATAMPDSTILCNGQSIQLNATNTVLGQTTNYIWADSVTSATRNVTNFGWYKVTLNQANGCTATDSVYVHTNVDVSLIASQDTTICKGSTITISGSIADKYQWGFVDSNRYFTIGNQTANASISVSPNNTTKYVLTGYKFPLDTIVKNVACAISDTVVVTVNQTPILDSLNAISVCANQKQLNLPVRLISPSNLQGGIGNWFINGTQKGLINNSPTSILLLDSLNGLPADTFYSGMNLNSSAVTKNIYLTYVYTSPIMAGGCTRKDSSLVRILAAPKVDAGSDLVLCGNIGVPYVLNSHSQAPANQSGTQGIWTQTLGNGLVTTNQGSGQLFRFNVQNAGVKYLPDTNKLKYTYTLSYALSNPLTTLNCSNADVMNITVKSTPVLDAGSDKQFCTSEGLFNMRIKQGITLSGYFTNSTGVIVSDTFNVTTANLYPATNKLFFVNDSSGCINKDSFTYTVYPAIPQVEAGTDKTICSNEPGFNIRNKQLITATTGYFTNSSGATISDVFNPFTAAKYPLVNKIYFIDGYTGCQSKDSFIYTVKVIPVVEAGTNKQFCSTEALFNMRTKQGITTSGYFTNSAGVTISDTFNVATANLYPLTNKLFFINDSLGCLSKDSFVYTVYPIKQVDAGTDKSLCSDESNFNIRSKQQITVTTGYFTNSSGTTISDVFNPSAATIYPMVNKIYFIDGYAGCETKDSFVYTVKRPAVVEAGTNKIMCSNDAAFSLRAKQGVTVSGYFANSLGVAISDTFVPAQALTYPATNKLYFVNDSTGCVGKDSFNYQVNYMPTVNAGSDKSYCATDTIINLKSTQQPQPTVGADFYDEQVNIVTSFNPTTAYKLPATNKLVYKHTVVINGFRCYGYDTAIFTVTPVAQLQPLTGDTVVAKNSVKTYSTPSNPYHTLVWNVTGGQLQGNQNNQAEIVWTDTGMANIKITAQNAACADVVFNQVVLVQGTSGIKEQSVLSSLKLYPNPANQSVTISLTSSKDTHIEIYGATMQLIKQVTAQSISGEVHEQLSTQDMANGVYFIKVTSGTQSGLFKLVVMK